MHSLLFSSDSAPENSRTSIFQTPAMQNLMQQVSASPDMFQNMMQSPYMQEMMQQMLQNPDLMASVSHFFYSWIIKSIFYRRVVFFMAPSLNRVYDDKFQHTSCGSSFAKGMFHFWLWWLFTAPDTALLCKFGYLTKELLMLKNSQYYLKANTFRGL